MNSLVTKPVHRLLLSLILPSLFTVLVSGSYNLVDGIFIGQKLGVNGTSANAYTFMIYALVYSFSALVSQGSSSLTTIYLGKDEPLNMIKVLFLGIELSILISILQGIMMWVFLPNLMSLFGASFQYYPYIKEFSLIFFIGSPFYFVAHTLLYSIRAQGNIKKIILINTISFFSNFIMGYILIMKCNLGFTGSAMATIFANIVTCLLSFIYYINYLNKYNFKLSNYIYLNKNLSLKILSMGLPFALTSIISVVLLSLYNRIAIIYGGAYGLASLSIVSSIYRYVISIMNAITSGAQPVISYNYGAKNYSRVKKALFGSFNIGTIFSIVLFIIVELCSFQIAQLFNSSNISFIFYTSKVLKIIMLSLPLQGFINIGTSYFQYINESKKSTIMVVLRQIILQVPLAIMLPLIFNINGLWLSYVFSDIIIFCVIIFVLYRRNFN
ncbi:MATE family efflux transporter [Apilactobacillus quenuiae]|uniref:MATE family efflux transporter n=1 Tax=Apilactobacillus quenuiae TaxID=2008377 RepID=UPI000D02191C|nr:MATE family efflux transporter [Apilactobacillus quenuiae]